MGVDTFLEARPGPDEGYGGGPGESLASLPAGSAINMDQEYTLLADQVNIIARLSATDMDGLVERLPVGIMRELASRLMSRMPAHMLATLVDEAYPRLHVDPARYLPTEIMQEIYAYMSPRDVIRCARTSRTWRAAAIANTRWRDFFHNEGWLTDQSVVKKLVSIEESRRKDHDRLVFRKQSSSEDGSVSKRHRSADQQQKVGVGDTSEWKEQHGRVEADIEREDPIGAQPWSPSRPGSTREHPTWLLAPDNRLFQMHHQTPRLDWLYLYKQRHRLEKNWQAGRYVPLRLPTVEHPSDGHTDCVYTIQYTGDHLVSGSRDRTIKIWDLSKSPTQYRCIRTLDKAHTSSVLCLQFDAADDVIISGGSDSFLVFWCFSTGEVMRKMTDAHRESILNLRFDDRYLITCSKDKTIKIWNRHAVESNDSIVPAASVDHLSCNGPETLARYTLLGTLHGHTAAVNAVQLHGGSIVSASGDRTIRLWDINTLSCVRQFSEHTKGIACLQFDGRRIISGSSDKTVRIFDVATAAQVGCLTGHGDLVRTVQARFGDHNKSSRALAQEATVADRERMAYLESHPEDHERYRYQASGARIPPGGGGNAWARIVSGSYDESVCIWKRDGKGGWTPAHCLYLDQILQKAQREQAEHMHDAAVSAQAQALRGLEQHDINTREVQPPIVVPAGMPVTSDVGSGQMTSNTVGASNQHDMPARPARAAHAQPTGVSNEAEPVAGIVGAANATTSQLTPAPMTRANEIREGRQARPARMMRESEDSKRLLKLQFDCRRIIACSQNKMIVGWDFANGDRELEEAAMCFADSM